MLSPQKKPCFGVQDPQLSSTSSAGQPGREAGYPSRCRAWEHHSQTQSQSAGAHNPDTTHCSPQSSGFSPRTAPLMSTWLAGILIPGICSHRKRSDVKHNLRKPAMAPSLLASVSFQGFSNSTNTGKNSKTETTANLLNSQLLSPMDSFQI